MTGLKRSIGLAQLTLYGIGTMIGAGIYALIGAVAGTSGSFAPYAFLVAAALAATTGASFAELASRYPTAAGGATYVQEGFNSIRLGQLTGALFVASGMVSAGVMFSAFLGYAQTFIVIPELTGVLLLGLAIGGVAAWGITQSVTLVVIITLLEAGALVVVVTAGLYYDATPLQASRSLPAPQLGIGGVLSGAVLAFYAYIGFEDMVTTAEEVRNPRHTVPLALIIAVIVTTALYAGAALVAVKVADPALLAASEAPMTLLFERVTPWPGEVVSLIALLAVTNGALVQIIMAARVIYGLGEAGTLPSWLARVHPRTQTPLVATVLITTGVVTATLLLPLEDLARATTTLLLVVFTLVNLALLRVRREPGVARAEFQVPLVIPVLGAASSAFFAVLSLRDLLGL